MIGIYKSFFVQNPIHKGSYAFSFCQKLSSVRTLGKTQLTSIGLGAFQNCERLALFSSTKVTAIWESAFDGCRLLPAFFFNYVKTIGKMLADELEMFFADVLDLLKFDFIDLVQANNIVGKDYILKQEKSKIKTLATYDNTVISVDYRSINNDENLENLKQGCLLVYLKMDEKTLNDVNKYYKAANEFDLFLEDFENNILENKSNVVCDISNLKLEDVVNKILASITDYYKDISI